MVDAPIDDTKDTAMSHAPSTPPLSAALGDFADPSKAPLDEAPLENDDAGVDLSLLKKKKKKKALPVAEDGEDAGEEGADAGDDAGLDLSLKKKKKKKVPKAEDDFAKKLEALDLEGEEGEGDDAAPAVDQGDSELGTGIWQHELSTDIPYELLLKRFYQQVEMRNPDHATSGSRSYKIPPPQCMREGNKKTIFANIADICKRMKRTDEHLTAYLFAELGTSGSVDGSRRLVIKGRFQQKQIENVLRKYIIEYVTCKTCRSPDTTLTKGENRLFFIECNVSPFPSTRIILPH